METFLRSMSLADIDGVADVHCAVFAHSRSSKLGKIFVRRMYQWYVMYQPDLSFVAILDNQIVGFVNGAFGDTSDRFRFCFFQMVWGFVRRPYLFLRPEMFEDWQSHFRGLLNVIRKEGVISEKSEGRKVTLDSIAVMENVRGKNIGFLLLHAFEHSAARLGANFMRLGVDYDNIMARRFYEKQGWHLVYENIDKNSANYQKSLC